MAPSLSSARVLGFVSCLFVSVLRMVSYEYDLNKRTLRRTRNNKNSIGRRLEQPLLDNLYKGYRPASTEAYLLEHAGAMGLGSQQYVETAAGCRLWKDASATNPEIYASLTLFRANLAKYTASVQNFDSNIADLRLQIAADQNYGICKTVDLHPDGVQGLFGDSSGHHGLSYTQSGFVEPLLPPMRHPEFCFDARKHLLDLNYLVHDFGALCRRLKPTSRIVLVDMGASLKFHSDKTSPAIYLTDLYHKFGFPFDHIYAWEVKPTPPSEVFDAVPRHLMPAYHWINMGVDATPGSRLNPFTTLADKYNADDLIVVKLDIDTPSLELPLAMQLLHDEGLLQLVDQFYFEHHVPLWELQRWWGDGVSSSIQESLELFHKLREQGVAAHFWV